MRPRPARPSGVAPGVEAPGLAGSLTRRPPPDVATSKTEALTPVLSPHLSDRHAQRPRSPVCVAMAVTTVHRRVRPGLAGRPRAVARRAGLALRAGQLGRAAPGASRGCSQKRTRPRARAGARVPCAELPLATASRTAKPRVGPGGVRRAHTLHAGRLPRVDTQESTGRKIRVSTHLANRARASGQRGVCRWPHLRPSAPTRPCPRPLTDFPLRSLL